MTAQTIGKQPAYLIVSADDFGYYRCVSAGILHAHRRGIVTATAVLANLGNFKDEVQRLRECPKLDVGVHLNLTTGSPFSDVLKERFAAAGGVFPAKFSLLKACLTREIVESEIRIEWRLQVQACLDAGLRPCFLNSHEHVHMLPWALPAMKKIAAEFGIQHIRLPTPDSMSLWPPASLIRDISLGFLARRGSSRLERGKNARLLGMSASGRLNMPYLEKCLRGLRPGRVYELMCHPGFFDASEITDTRLLGYHDWEGETKALTDATLPSLLATNGIRLVSYRDLDEMGLS